MLGTWIIKIKPDAAYYNCHWYCTKVGEVFTANKYDKKSKCYIVMINKVEHFVSENHAQITILNHLTNK